MRVLPQAFPSMGAETLRQGSSAPCLIGYVKKAQKTKRMLIGDPAATGVVTESTPEQAAALIAWVLSGLGPAERSRVIAHARARADVPAADVVPIAAVIPQGATQEQANRLLNGLSLLLLSLGSSGGSTNVATVSAKAGSLASGLPFASDPLTAERSGEVILAKSLLEAMLLDDDAAKEVHSRLGLEDALQQAAAQASAGRSEHPEGGFLADDDMLRAIYDCAEHNLPLGGDPLQGGLLDSLKAAAGKLLGQAEKEASKAVTDAADEATGTTASQQLAESLDAQNYYNARVDYWKREYARAFPDADGATNEKRAEDSARVETESKYPDWNGGRSLSVSRDLPVRSGLRVAPTPAAGADDMVRVTPITINRLGATAEAPQMETTRGDLAESTAETLSASKEALKRTLADMHAAQDKLEAYQAKVKDSALDASRIAWAAAFLDAPDSVAEMLAKVSPSTSDPATFLQSALQLLPAAKSTGNLNTIKAVISAIKAAATGSASAADVATFLSGDVGAEDIGVAGPDGSASALMDASKRWEQQMIEMRKE